MAKSKGEKLTPVTSPLLRAHVVELERVEVQGARALLGLLWHGLAPLPRLRAVGVPQSPPRRRPLDALRSLPLRSHGRNHAGPPRAGARGVPGQGALGSGAAPHARAACAGIRPTPRCAAGETPWWRGVDCRACRAPESLPPVAVPPLAGRARPELRVAGAMWLPSRRCSYWSCCPPRSRRSPCTRCRRRRGKSGPRTPPAASNPRSLARARARSRTKRRRRAELGLSWNSPGCAGSTWTRSRRSARQRPWLMRGSAYCLWRRRAGCLPPWTAAAPQAESSPAPQLLLPCAPLSNLGGFPC